MRRINNRGLIRQRDYSRDKPRSNVRNGIKNNSRMRINTSVISQHSPQRPKYSSEILAREYELARGYEERLRQEFEKYKQLYLDEKELVKSKERILEATKRKEIEARQGVVLAEQELEKEKKRLIEIYKAVEIVRENIKKESEEVIRIKDEIKKVIEDEKNVRQSFSRFEVARKSLENAKYMFDTAQKQADEELRRILKGEGFENVTNTELDIAKELITKPLDEVQHRSQCLSSRHYLKIVLTIIMQIT